MPNGKVAEAFFAKIVGRPGRIVIGVVAALASVGRLLAVPTWYTVLIPLPPLPFATKSVLLKIVSPRKLLSLPALSAVGYGLPVAGSFTDVIEKLPIICGAVVEPCPGVAISTPVELMILSGVP